MIGGCETNGYLSGRFDLRGGRHDVVEASEPNRIAAMLSAY